MLEMFKKYKLSIIFLMRFAFVFIPLMLSYEYYLDSFESDVIQDSDSMTYEVAAQSSNLAEILGFNSFIYQHAEESSVKFILDNTYRIKIVEGCNGLSVIILFVAFIIAFGGRIIDQTIFIVSGVLWIHLSNVARITFLAYIYTYHYDYANFFHDYVFPSIIYGMTFLLWVVWVNYFAIIGKNKNK